MAGVQAVAGLGRHARTEPLSCRYRSQRVETVGRAAACGAVPLVLIGIAP